jgi:uncharacterized C2H2 Zn-finger protein
MVLRCPRCSTLKFFGRPQVLGELVVCPKCEMVFRWGDVRPAKGDADRSTRDARDRNRSDGKRGKR